MGARERSFAKCHAVLWVSGGKRSVRVWCCVGVVDRLESVDVCVDLRVNGGNVAGQVEEWIWKYFGYV